MNNSKHAIVIFAREPVSGKVKSRLTGALNDAERLDLYKRMLVHSSIVIGRIGNASAYLYSTPDKQHPFLKVLSKRFDFHQQVQANGDLGYKMTMALEDVLEHSDKAILIGSDCPFITSDYLASAITQLRNDPVVIGPATDGGFVMIGTTDHRLMEPLFQNIEWGNSEVLDKLLENAKRQGTSIHLMQPLNDIDRPEDLALLDDFTWFE